MVQRCQRTTNVNPKSRNTINETVDDMSLSFIVKYSVNCKIMKNADIRNMQVALVVLYLSRLCMAYLLEQCYSYIQVL